MGAVKGLLLYLTLVALLVRGRQPELEEENDLLPSLTVDSLEFLVSSNQHVFVLFLAEGTGDDDPSVSALSEAALHLAENFKFKMGRLALPEDSILKSRFGLPSLPSLALFEHHRRTFYNQNWTAENITAWATSIMDHTFQEISSESDFQAFLAGSKTKILAIYPKSSKDKYRAFESLVEQGHLEEIADFSYGHAESTAVVPTSRDITRDAIVIYPGGPGQELNFVYDRSLLDVDEIVNFVQMNSRPTVAVLSPETSHSLLGLPNQRILLLVVDLRQNTHEIIQIFTASALANRFLERPEKRFQFVIVDWEDRHSPEIEDLFEFLGIHNPHRLPRLYVLNTVAGATKKYRLEDEINNSTLQNFIEEVHENRAAEFKRQEEVEENESSGEESLVRALVSGTFKSEVYQSKMNVLVLFCSHRDRDICTIPKNIMTDLARELTEFGNILSFGFFDVIRNEDHPEEITTIPLLKLYIKRSHLLTIVYTGEFQLQAVTKWLTFHLSGWEPPAATNEQAVPEESNSNQRKTEL